MALPICVFCAASDQIAPHYFSLARGLGEEMARRGHSLVFGAGQTGLMGEVARAVHQTGGTVIGVIPRRLDWKEVVYESADELIYTDTMRERKAIMAERASAFIILPGGIGTLEEALEIITLRHLGYHTKPIVVLDGHGYFAPLLAMLERSVREGFAQPSLMEAYYIAKDVDDALHRIEVHADAPAGVDPITPAVEGTPDRRP